MNLPARLVKKLDQLYELWKSDVTAICYSLTHSGSKGTLFTASELGGDVYNIAG